MEKIIHLILSCLKKSSFIIFLFILLTVSSEVNAVVEPPDPGGDPTGGGGTPVGGGAPVGDGLYVFLGATLAYTIFKMQKIKSQQQETFIQR